MTKMCISKASSVLQGSSFYHIKSWCTHREECNMWHSAGFPQLFKNKFPLWLNSIKSSIFRTKKIQTLNLPSLYCYLRTNKRFGSKWKFFSKGLYIGQKNNNFVILSQIIVFNLTLLSKNGLEFQNKIPDGGNPDSV